MNAEQLYFLRILSDFVQRKETTEQSNIDWPQVIAIGEKHELSGIIYRQCKRYLPEQERKRLERAFAAECYFHANQVRQFNSVAAELSKHSIRFIPVKGLKIAQYYPEPTCRTMGDIDLLVDKGQLAELKCVFETLGFSLEKDTEHEWEYGKQQFHYELHEFLLNADSPRYKSVAVFFMNYWDHAALMNGSEYELDWNFHFLYLIQHIRQHLLWEGIGFRQFLDLAVLITKIDFDWDYIIATCKEIGLYDLLCTSLAFVNRWFGVEVPLRVGLSEEFYLCATEKVFEDGVFGFSNDSNKVNVVKSAAEKSKLPLGVVKIIVALRMMFPSYREMANAEKYSFLNGRPYLLPIAWIYRAWYAVKHKRTRGMKQLQATVMAKQDALDEQNRMLEQWGI